MKTCSECGDEKDETRFSRLLLAPDGLRYSCKDCVRKYNQEREKNPKTKRDAAKKKEYDLARYHTNSEAILAAASVKYWADPEKARRYQREHKKPGAYLKPYGLTIEDYNRMFLEQRGACSICNKKEEKLCVDHDHKTGKVRGLLCLKCNFGLGFLQDSKILLSSACKYLDKHS